jgi:hypothetical protein
MVDWPTVASLATAIGTLVLAIATFAAVRSANRAALAAEHSLLAGLRPLLVAARPQDPPQKVMWADQHFARAEGGRAVVEIDGDVVYLAAALRNAGNGLALLHGWYPYTGRLLAEEDHEPPERFRRLMRDLYVAAGDIGFWQGSLRDSDDPHYQDMLAAIEAHDPLTVDILYGDHEGGQRAIVRFALTPIEPGYLFAPVRYWNIDLPDPR